MAVPGTKLQGEESTASGLNAFEQAWDQFFAAVRRARGRAAREGQAGGMTLAQFQLIAAFGDHEELPVGEVAVLGGVTAPTATRMLDGLERDGIVERAHSTQDRRRVTVRLTAEGRKILATKRRAVAAKRRKMFESLHPDERREAAHLLGRLAALFDEL
jgi:MarR family transcriptional regulator, organic hydroperoxide resistance regulator